MCKAKSDIFKGINKIKNSKYRVFFFYSKKKDFISLSY